MNVILQAAVRQLGMEAAARDILAGCQTYAARDGIF
jgi:hypothetical protein